MSLKEELFDKAYIAINEYNKRAYTFMPYDDLPDYLLMVFFQELEKQGLELKEIEG